MVIWVFIFVLLTFTIYYILKYIKKVKTPAFLNRYMYYFYQYPSNSSISPNQIIHIIY